MLLELHWQSGSVRGEVAVRIVRVLSTVFALAAACTVAAAATPAPLSAATGCPVQTLAIPATAATPNYSDPFATAVDSSGNIYVADATTNYIHKFDSSGTEVMAIPPTAATPNLSDPQGLAVDADGYIYVAVRDNQDIIKFNSSGTQTMEIPK